MKRYLIIIAVLTASASAQVAPPVVPPSAPAVAVKVTPPDPRDAEVKYLKEESDRLRRNVSDLTDQCNKLKTQRNQLASGLLDYQQLVTDLQTELQQLKAQPAPAVPAKEEKK